MPHEWIAMSLADLRVKPAHITTDEHFPPWFEQIVDRLFNGVDFLVNGFLYRFAELEGSETPGNPSSLSLRA
jgi:hypothetical protein